MDTPAEPDSGNTPAKKPSAGSAKRSGSGGKPTPGRGSTPRSGTARKPAAAGARASGPRTPTPVADETIPVSDEPAAVADEQPPTIDEDAREVPVETPESPTEDAAHPPRRGFTIPKLTIPTLSAGSSAIARLGRAVDAQRHADDEAAEQEVAEQDDAPGAHDVDPDTHTRAEPESETEPEAEPEPEAETEAEPEPEGAAAEVAVRVAELPVPDREPDTTAMLTLRGLTKRFDDTVAVNAIDLEVPAGTIYGIVGPNGAGKTTTLSMITGLLRPDAGSVVVHGADVWADPVAAKRQMGVLPDRLRLFDRLTGAQLLYYSAVLRGLDAAVARTRVADLGAVFRIEDALGRLVSDYSSGMTKKVALAAAMIHAPRLLVLDEPFESVDPVSASTVTDILRDYTAAGGTVLLSSHSMALVERICDRVAVVVDGEILADGTVEEVRGDGSLEERFVQLAGGTAEREGVEWLHSFSD